MATLNTLRTRGGVIVSIVIGIALLAFLLGDLSSAGNMMNARKMRVGEIDGNKIVTDDKRATNIPGVYAAGDCVKGLQQIAKAVYDGMLAGTQAIRYLKKN